jgi:hypothetical protein
MSSPEEGIAMGNYHSHYDFSTPLNVILMTLNMLFPHSPLLEHRGVSIGKAAQWHFSDNNNRSIDDNFDRSEHGIPAVCA